MAIEFYKEYGELGYLANYSDHGFFDNGVFYKTVEHYYQANKFDNEIIRNKIINADTPKEASIIGRDRSNIRIDNFSDIKLDVMEKGVYLKFKNNKDIRSKLIETGQEEIKEMSVKENYWGVGPNLDGENHIGTILMNVREKLKYELRDEIISNCSHKKVYVLGHRSPDVDSLVSALLLTNILKKLGIDAVFSVRDENYVDDDIKRDFIKDKPFVINDCSNKYFILVDHNKLDGIDEKCVIGAFDHHRISGEVSDLIEIEYSSTALLIFDLFKDLYDFSSYEKELIYLSVMSDTDFFTSRRYREYDKDLVSLLGKYDLEMFKKKYLKLNDFSLDYEKNLFSDYKEYDYNGLKVKRSIIKSNYNEMNLYIEKYMNKMMDFGINLIIWCTYDKLGTRICYKNRIYDAPYFTTSTFIVLDYLKEKECL